MITNSGDTMMDYSARLLVALTLGCIGLLTSANASEAQNAPARAITVVGGAFQYDLSGTGTTGFGGLRLEFPFNRYVLVEPAFTYAQYTPQGGGNAVRMFFPEAQLQFALPLGRVRPFVGLGLGRGIFRNGDRSSSETWGSVGGGARFRLSELVGMRAELRVRANERLTASAAELTLGVSRGL